MSLPRRFWPADTPGDYIKLGDQFARIQDMVRAITSPGRDSIRVVRRGGKPDVVYRGKFIDRCEQALRGRGVPG